MKKLLIAITILSLFTIAGILKFKNTNYSLPQPTDVQYTLTSQVWQAPKKVFLQQNEVTLGQWSECYGSNFLKDFCFRDENYFKIKNQVGTELFQSPNCDNYLIYFLNNIDSNPDLPNSQNNWYQDCYLNPKILQIAYSNSCYWIYFNILYIQCAGL